MAYDRVLAGVQWGDSSSLSDSTRLRVNPVALTALKRCATRLSPRIARAEPMAMYKTWYVLGEADSAWNLLTRIRAGLPPRAQVPILHGSALYEAVLAAEKYPPYRGAYVDRVLLSLDSVPNDTARYKLFSHHLRFRHALALMDRSSITREGNAIVREFAEWARQVSPAHLMMAQEQASVVVVLSTLAELDAIELGVGSALTTMEQQAKIAFGSQAPTILSTRRIFGTRPPALAESAWVLEPNHTIRREPIPSGKPTLMLFLYDCAGGDRSWCIEEYARIRRLHQQYGDSVTFVAVTITKGNVGLELLTDSAQERAAMLKWYLETAALPVRLIVEQTQYARKPDPDGRMKPLDTRAFEIYGKQNGFLGGAVVLDRSGVASAAHFLNDAEEPIVRILLDAAIRQRPK